LETAQFALPESLFGTLVTVHVESNYMPTYDYECTACEHKFEFFQKITDDPIKRCPKCKKLKLSRLFGTGLAIVFKGSGFYQTDYRSDSYKKSAESDKKASEPASSESKSSSTEAKPSPSNDPPASKPVTETPSASAPKRKSRKKSDDS
jgi:putative FmdB family regulatory protein